MPQQPRLNVSTEFTTFGALLRYLRRRAQLTQTELATACGYNPSQISRLEKNQRVPDRATLLALFVPALGLEDEPELAQRLLRLAISARSEQVTNGIPRVKSAPIKPLRNNLPLQATPFIGRSIELDALHLLLTNPDIRLVTILGPGGMGKTRLSLEIASTQNGNFVDGVFFIPLAPVSSAEYLVAAIAEAVKCQFYPGREPKQTLLEYFRENSMLLVLDNFEHLLEGVEFISDILQVAPKVKILTTSRERLNLQAETVFRIEGMDVPDDKLSTDALEFGAVKLFVQTAHRVQLDFHLDNQNLADVVQICRQVGGMPLGIELAAGWVDTLSPTEISREIESSLDFLKTGSRDLPMRQRSIHAVFDSSWQRMTLDECRVFSWLSVFRGGFTREAAQRVTGASIEILSSLVNKSFLRYEPSGRFSVHELLRQYTETKLNATPADHKLAHEAHALYYTKFLEKQWEFLQSPNARAAADEIETEIGNVRAAWQFIVEQCRATEIHTFTRIFWIFFDQKNRFDEGIALLQQAVIGLSNSINGDPVDQLEVALGLALSVQGNFYTTSGSPQRSEPLIRRGLALLRKHTSSEDLFIALVSLWLANLFLDKAGTLKRIAQEALSIAELTQEPRNLAGALFILGTSHLEFDEYQEAKAIGEEALKYALESEDPFMKGVCSGLLLARTARDMGDFEQAQKYYLQGIEYFEAADRTYYVCMVSNEIVPALAANGDFETASRFLKRAMTFFVKAGITYQVVTTIISAAILGVAQGHFERAVKLLAVVISHPAVLQNDRRQAQILLSDLQTKLPTSVFAVAYEHGQTLDLESVVTELLQEQ